MTPFRQYNAVGEIAMVRCACQKKKLLWILIFSKGNWGTDIQL
jgi:hypothetical protein